jgi:hypothetical protein
MYTPSILAVFAAAMLGRASAQSFAPNVNDIQAQAAAAQPDSSVPVAQDNADDEQLFPWGAKITVKGLDNVKLTPAQEIYVEDAVGFAFDKVNQNTDERAISSHLLGMGSSNNAVRASESKLRYTPVKKWTDWHSMFFFAGGNGGCHFCGTSSYVLNAARRRTKVSYPLIAHSLNDHPLTGRDRRTLLGSVDSAHIKAQWETKFCDVLANSPWPELNGAHDCSIEMDNGNDHNPVADFLAAHSSA